MLNMNMDESQRKTSQTLTRLSAKCLILNKFSVICLSFFDKLDSSSADT